MAQTNIYQFINEYDINSEVRASYNSNSDIIDNSSTNYINIMNNYNYIDIHIINYMLNYTYNNFNDDIPTHTQDTITFHSDPAFIGEQCSICWDNVENLESMAVTKCRSKPHVFHKSCITSWTKNSSSCPNCRCHL